MFQWSALTIEMLTAKQAATLTHLDGDMYFQNYAHPMPMLESISGDMYFQNYAHPMPMLKYIEGYADLETYEHPLPMLTRIGGGAFFGGYTHPLPALSCVEGYFNLEGYAHPLSDALLAHLEVPSVPLIDAQIADAIGDGASLDMDHWHNCGTSHCRAGWAIALAGAAGTQLERKHGSDLAGYAIYQVSRPGVPVPDFFASNTDALADILRCAAEQRAAIG